MQKKGLLFIGLFLMLIQADQTVSAQGLVFSKAKTYPIASAAQSIVTGDFNRDGSPDLAVSEGVGKHISVYLGDGKGGFSKPRRYPVSNTIVGFLIEGDFDRDGILDLVSLNTARNSISLLRGTGDGGFHEARIVALVWDTGTGVTGDFNHDGKLDIIATSGSEEKIAVLLGDGKGNFSEAAYFNSGTGKNLRHMVSADFNIDGNPDVAISEETGHQIVLLMGDGKGGFSSPSKYQMPEKSRPRGMAIGDFNTDGKPDLAVSSLSTVPKKIWILLGDGKGGFREHQTLFANTSHWSLTTGDFNGDAKIDLAVYDLDDRVTLFMGQGDGFFSSPLPYPAPGSPADQFYNTIVSGDFNHDGFTDLAMASEVPPLVTVLINGLANAYGTIRSEEFYRKPRPIQVSHLRINPKNPDIVYLSTVNQGVFRSRDKGNTWKPINTGIKNLLVYALVIDPVHPETLYIGTWGGGIYKSTNGGDSWFEIDEGLTHTAVNGLVLHPENSRILYATTSMKTFVTRDGGQHWAPIESGENITPVSNVFAVPSLALLPPSTFFIGSDRGLRRWSEQDRLWSFVEGPFKDKSISVLAFEPNSGKVFLATKNSGLWVSSDEGETWSRLSGANEKINAREIIIPPGQNKIMYILDDSRGIIMSKNQGKSWVEINSGVEHVKPRALVVDPRDKKYLYLGTYADGLFRSWNGGKTWKPIKNFPLQSVEESLAPVLASEKKTSTIPPPPPEFAKCNACHGWTEPNLKFFRKNYWQMKPSRRDWGLTVMRMGLNAHLTPEESANILKFMNKYYGLTEDK